MAKRYSDTERFAKDFYKGLPAPYKLLWEYVCANCDYAGFWSVEEAVAQYRIGDDAMISLEKALALYNADSCRVLTLKGGSLWFLTGFIEFQYGKLNIAKNASGGYNKVHRLVNEKLKHYGIEHLIDKETGKFIGDSSASTSGAEPTPEAAPTLTPTVGVYDKDKDKDKDKDIDKEKEKRKSNFPRDIELICFYYNSQMIGKTIKPMQRIATDSGLHKKIRARINEYSIEEVEDVICRAANSTFLNGGSANRFIATADWIFSPNNFQKIYNGNYDNRTARGIDTETVQKLEEYSDAAMHFAKLRTHEE